MKKEMIKDVKYEWDLFEVLYNEDNTDYYFDFIVNEIISWNMDNTPSEVEKYMEGHIKWDGCSHIIFGEEGDGYIHLCGKHCFDNHINLIQKLYELASKIITNFE